MDGCVCGAQALGVTSRNDFNNLAEYLLKRHEEESSFDLDGFAEIVADVMPDLLTAFGLFTCIAGQVGRPAHTSTHTNQWMMEICCVLCRFR